MSYHFVDVQYILFVVSSFAASHNLRARGKGIVFFFLALCIPVIALTNLVAVAVPEQSLRGVVGDPLADALRSYSVKSIPTGLKLMC